MPEEPYLKLIPNDIYDLSTIWKHIGKTEKNSFHGKYGDIVALLSVVIDEPMLMVTIRVWDPSFRCFTFNKEDLTPTVEEYSILINLKLQSPDKVYVRKPRLGFQKKLASMLGVKVEVLNPN